MRENIIKDLVLHRRLILFMAVIFPAYMGFFGSRLDRPGVFVVFGSFMYAIATLMLFTREDKFKSMGFGLSLPTTRRDVLASRYVLNWALMILLYALGAAAVAAAPGTKLGPVGFKPGIVLASIGWMSFYYGALTPLIVRFGLAGIIVFLVFMQVLGIAAMSFPVISRFITGDIRSFVAAVRTAMAAVQGTLGPAGFAAVLIAVIILWNLASFGLSLRFFKRKEY